MFRNTLTISSLMVALGTASYAEDATTLHQSPPGDPYVQVSDVLPLPEFLPGMGTLFVNPQTLPAGPFLAYDHDGKLSATIYMTPLEDLQNGTSFDNLGLGSEAVKSVDIYYNAGHPGVEKPHAHIALFHDDGAKERLAE